MEILSEVRKLADELVRDKFVVVPTQIAGEIATMLSKVTCLPVMGGSFSNDLQTRCLYID